MQDSFHCLKYEVKTSEKQDRACVQVHVCRHVCTCVQVCVCMNPIVLMLLLNSVVWLLIYKITDHDVLSMFYC